jgi:hypothetical protein
MIRKTWPFAETIAAKDILRTRHGLRKIFYALGIVSESSPCFRILYMAYASSSLFDNQRLDPNGDEMF